MVYVRVVGYQEVTENEIEYARRLLGSVRKSGTLTLNRAQVIEKIIQAWFGSDFTLEVSPEEMTEEPLPIKDGN